MKPYILILFLYSISLISYSQVLDFEFCNSENKKYNSTSLCSQLEKEYNTKFDEWIVLLETPELSDSLYLLQNKILDKLDAESLQLIYITACLMQEKNDRYHTSMETAKEIMGNSNKFKVRILDSSGKIIFESYEVIPRKRIEELVQRK